MNGATVSLGISSLSQKPTSNVDMVGDEPMLTAR